METKVTESGQVESNRESGQGSSWTVALAEEEKGGEEEEEEEEEESLPKLCVDTTIL
jgi:hypothetical protein